MSASEPNLTLVQRPWLLVALALAAYVLAFACFYPTVLTISDEAAYMRQAAAFAHGNTTIAQADGATGELRQVRPSDYPPGTSLLMAPLAKLGGWRAGFLLGPACCAGCVLLLAAMLRREGRSPLFALLFLAYPPVLVISRCGMSDLPAALCVTASLYCFLRGDRAPWRLAAGLLGGATLLFRETAPLLLAFLFAGALLRRERATWALLLGGLAGCALRLLAAQLVYGDAFFMKQSHPGFSLGALPQNAPLYAVALLVFVPGGLALAALYRGARRLELLLTLGAFTLLHLLYEYNAAASGGLKQWVLAPRFMIPLLPVLLLLMAEPLPRLWNAALARLGVAGRVSAWRAARFGVLGLALAICAEAAVVSYEHSRWQVGQRAIVNALYAGTDSHAPVVTNLEATRKFINELNEEEYGPRLVEPFDGLTKERLAVMLARHGKVCVALLERRDSEYWREAGEQRQLRLREVAGADVLESYSATFPGGERLLIYEITSR